MVNQTKAKLSCRYSCNDTQKRILKLVTKKDGNLFKTKFYQKLQKVSKNIFFHKTTHWLILYVIAAATKFLFFVVSLNNQDILRTN